MGRAADVEFDLAVGIGDDSPESDLGPGACRGRDGDGRGNSTLDWLRLRPFVVAYRATVRDNHPNGLGTVQRAPAAQPDEAIALFFLVNPRASIHHRNRRVADDFAPDDIIPAGGAERLGDALEQAGTHDTRIGNDHGA